MATASVQRPDSKVAHYPETGVIESASQIPLLGKGGVRGGSIDLHAELFWNLTEPPLAPPLPRRGI